MPGDDALPQTAGINTRNVGTRNISLARMAKMQSNRQPLSAIEIAFANRKTVSKDVYSREAEYEDKHRLTRFGYSNTDPKDQ